MQITMDLYTLSRAYGSGYADDALTQDLPLPSSIDREAFKALLYARSTGLEVVYSNPKTLRAVLIAYGKSRLPDWNRMQKALNLEYEIINNYDRTEEHTFSNSSNNSSTTESTENAKNNSNAFSQSAGDSSNPSKTTNYQKAYDSNEETLTGHSETVAGVNKSASNTEGTASSDGRSSSKGSADSNGTESIRAYGNIGVTTSQQMIESELNLRKVNSLMDIIVSEYMSQACIMVW